MNNHIEVIKAKETGLFTNYIFKAIPLAFDESMSYYETLCGLLNYLKNTIIPTVNNNADAVAELQNLFDELHEYVEHYFDNLDVQEEINNKLDDMVEQGTLQEIIADYLNSKAVFGFDNIQSMKESTNLINGSYAKTLGYYSKNDGGSATYKIRTITNDDVVDESFIIELDDNTLIAELIIEDDMNIDKIGAKHNGEDDTPYISKMLSKLNYAKLGINSYTIITPFKLLPNQSLKGENYSSILIINNNLNNSMIELTKNNEICNLTINITSNSWNGNIFELSSKTLLNIPDLIRYENLKINIHDINLNTSSGTFLYLWASNIDEDNNVYNVYGLWNINVHNINHHGFLNYVERTYVYNNTGSDAWITKNVFKDCVFDSVEYGWYGNKNDESFNDNHYKTQNITIMDCTIQCGSDSKNFIYTTGEGNIKIYGSIPYDWSISNPSYKAIKVKNNVLSGELNILNNSFNENYITFIQFTNSVSEDLYTYLGDYLKIGGIPFKYKFRPVHLQMGVGAITNYLVYKIGELDASYIKRNFNFELYFNASLPIANISINVDYQGNCTPYYDKLSSLLAPNTNFKILKKNNDLFIAFKYRNDYAYLKQKPYPFEDLNYFLDLHITKIGDVDITNYDELTLTQFT